MAMDALNLASGNNPNNAEEKTSLSISNELAQDKPNTMQLFRVKGILSVRDDTTIPESTLTFTNNDTDRQYILQAVNDLWDIRPCDSSTWEPSEERFSKLIFIGKFLNRTVLEAGLKSCLE
mmetsp:Transcript_53864/g.64809  ORF Transcript_53864/g.64809 Transcript_53864/m.64809 type:complete len:121 (+) Transcript_53864:256-618(+)